MLLSWRISMMKKTPENYSIHCSILHFEYVIGRKKNELPSYNPRPRVSYLFSKGGRRMRRATNPTRKISITIPESTYNILDKTLSYSQSRSAFIAGAIKEKLDGYQGESVGEASTRTLMIHLQHKNDVDFTLKHLLLQILSE
jgi:hypothetical protein